MPSLRAVPAMTSSTARTGPPEVTSASESGSVFSAIRRMRPSPRMKIISRGIYVFFIQKLVGCCEMGMERQYFAVTPDMVEPLAGIGISVTDHALYLTVTSRGAVRIVPVRQANSDGEQNEYDRTKEIAMMQAREQWVRLYTDMENRCYRVFPAPADRFGDPQLPMLKPAKIFRLAFRDKNRLIDSTEHTLFQRWAARDRDPV